jgi:hypothetical protein
MITGGVGAGAGVARAGAVGVVFRVEVEGAAGAGV